MKCFPNRVAVRLAALVIVAWVAFAAASAAHAAPSASGSSSSPAADGDSFVNVRLNVLGLLVKMLNVDVDFKVSNEWTVGPSISFWNYDYDTSLFTNDRLRVETAVFGARATWSKNGAYQTGLYVSPMLKIVSAKATGISKATGASVSGTARGPILIGMVGYHWWFDNFMVNVGGGLAVGAASSKVEVSDGVTSSSAESTRSAGITIEGMVGYTF